MRQVFGICVVVVGISSMTFGAPKGDVVTPKVTAKTLKTSVALGDVFEVKLIAIGPSGVTWRFPKEAGNESIALRTPQVAGLSESAFLPVQSHVYEAQAFAIADANVPPIVVSYRLPNGKEGTTKSAPIALQIISLLPKDAKEQKLSDIRGPLSIGVGRSFWIMLAIVLVMISALMIWMWLCRRPETEPLAQVEIAPDTEALQALDALIASDVRQRAGCDPCDGYRPFYIRLTEIVKRYLERRLKWPILEMTSAETVAFLRDHDTARDLVSPMRDLAGAADQVKFARQEGLQEEARRHSDAVREMIGILEKRLTPLLPVETRT
jgi:hypothetical protein